MPLNMKSINNFTRQKINRSVDMTFTQTITHQKDHVESGCSMRSALDVSNTLHIFTKEPITEREFEQECIKVCINLNFHHPNPVSYNYICM